MDSLDEKMVGTPVMEIDEPVSIRDRESAFALHHRSRRAVQLESGIDTPL